jgi:type IV pilus assembly protein PilM
MSLFQKTESYLGVDIGAHGIKLVELKKTKGRPQLWTYGFTTDGVDIHLTSQDPSVGKSPEELLAEKGKMMPKNNTELEKNESIIDVSKHDPRIDKYAEMLKELWKQSKASTNIVTASLPISYVFHSVVTLPQVDEKELAYHVNAKVKKMLPRPIEEMQVVHQVIPNDDKKAKFIRVLVTAAPKKLISFYTNIFQKAGLQLSELETEAFSLERALVGRDKSTSMIVDIGAERTNFFIIDGSIPVTHRSIRAGGTEMNHILMNNLGVDEPIAGQIKKDIAKMSDAETENFVKVFDRVLNPIVKEIDYSFNLFLKQTGNQGKHPEKIILTGGSAVFPFVKKYIGSKFDMKVFLGDPWARVVYQQGLKSILDDLGPRMSVSIGLALRKIV